MHTDSELIEGEVPDIEDDQDIKDGVLAIVRSFEADDEPAHDFYRQKSRKNELYWNYIQDIFWSDVANDYRLIGERDPEETDDVDIDEYNTIINVYRAYGESIIAALTAGLPYVRFYPADADNPDDILSGKASSKISELIARHNDAQFLFIHMLYIKYTQTFLAAYNYTKQDNSFGTVSRKVFGKVQEPITKNLCPECQYAGEEGETECPTCSAPKMPVPLQPTDMGMQEVTKEVGTEEVPRSREIIEVYGTANVKLPYYATRIEDCPYLILETEQHYSLWRSLYPDFADQIEPMASDQKYFRKPADGYTFDNRGLLTAKRVWLRPWAYEILGEDEKADKLRLEYPDGLYAVILNDLVVECVNEKMDDHWTLCKDPLTRHVNGQPLGQGAVPVQDMVNDLVYLTMDTIKHGVGETFADPTVIDFNTYNKHRNKAGNVFPAKSKHRDIPISSAFYQQKNATLSQEVKDFFGQLEQFGQFVTGALPSIFGGHQQGGGKTLGEYEISRNQGMQRLSIPWKSVNTFYADVMKKAVRGFANALVEDEKFVQKKGTGFVNVWIRRAELTGRVGDVIAETSEQFPVSWAQKKALLLEMLALGKEPIDVTLFHPQNTTTVGQIFGMPELYIPGEDDRNKQLFEITELLKAQPIMDPMMGMETPTIMPDIMLDNGPIHIEVLKAWANSDEGQEAKVNNPGGYQNVIAHLQAHMMMAQPVAPEAPLDPEFENAPVPEPEI